MELDRSCSTISGNTAMITWTVLISFLALYVHIVECDFGEKVNSNGTTMTSALMKENKTSAVAMDVLPMDGVDIRKAPLKTEKTQEDEYKPLLPDTSITTETPLISHHVSSGGVYHENLKGSPLIHSFPSLYLPAANQLESHDFQDEPFKLDYFDAEKVKLMINSLGTNQLQNGLSYDENAFIQPFHQVQSFNSFHSPYITESQLSDSSAKKYQSYNHDEFRQGRINQIEAAKSYIKQIQAEQEYALKSQEVHDRFNKQFKFHKPQQWDGKGFGLTYLSPFPQTLNNFTPSRTETQSLKAQQPVGIYGNPFSPVNNYLVSNNYNTVWRNGNMYPKQWDESSKSNVAYENQWNSPLKQFSGVTSQVVHQNLGSKLAGISSQLSTLQDTGHPTQRKHFIDVHTQWNTLQNPSRTYLDFQSGSSGASTYPGPTASPMVLSSGFLDETEEVKQAKNIHLRAVNTATGLASHWKGANPAKPLS